MKPVDSNANDDLVALLVRDDADDELRTILDSAAPGATPSPAGWSAIVEQAARQRTSQRPRFIWAAASAAAILVVLVIVTWSTRAEPDGSVIASAPPSTAADSGLVRPLLGTATGLSFAVPLPESRTDSFPFAQDFLVIDLDTGAARRTTTTGIWSQLVMSSDGQLGSVNIMEGGKLGIAIAPAGLDGASSPIALTDDPVFNLGTAAADGSPCSPVGRRALQLSTGRALNIAKGASGACDQLQVFDSEAARLAAEPPVASYSIEATAGPASIFASFDVRRALVIDAAKNVQLIDLDNGSSTEVPTPPDEVPGHYWTGLTTFWSPDARYFFAYVPAGSPGVVVPTTGELAPDSGLPPIFDERGHPATSPGRLSMLDTLSGQWSTVVLPLPSNATVGLVTPSTGWGPQLSETQTCRAGPPTEGGYPTIVIDPAICLLPA